MKFFNKLTVFLILISFIFSGETFARKGAAERRIDRDERAAQRTMRRLHRPKATKATKASHIKRDRDKSDKKRFLAKRKKRVTRSTDVNKSLRTQKRFSKKQALTQLNREEKKSPITASKPKTQKSVRPTPTHAAKKRKVLRPANNVALSPDKIKKTPIAAKKAVVRAKDFPQDLKNDLKTFGLQEHDFHGYTLMSQKKLTKDLANMEKAEKSAQNALQNYKLAKALGHDVSGVSEKDLHILEIATGQRSNGVGITQRLRNFFKETYGFQV